jgi:hypothetical protein
MNRIVIEQQASAEGVLNITLSLGKDEAGRNVRVTVEPANPEKKMTPEEWRAAVLATAGGWQGEFERPEQGKLEERESLS